MFLRWLLLVSLVLAPYVTCWSAAPSRDPAKEQVIVRELTARHPRVVPLFTDATRAYDADDFPTAARLYRQVLERAPQYDVAMRRLGMALLRMGKLQEGRHLIEQAVAIRRSAENLICLAVALQEAAPGQRASSADLERALTCAQEANRLAKGQDADCLATIGQLALLLERPDLLRQTAAELSARFPARMETHVLAGIAAASDGHWMRAEGEIRRAERLGFPAEDARRLLGSGIHRMAMIWLTVDTVLVLSGAWMLGLLVLWIVGKAMSNATLRAIESTDPNQQVSQRELALRRRYRTLIGVAGTYYYVSIPFLILCILAVTGGIICGFLWMGRIPIKLTLVLVVVALVTIYRSIASLFIRVSGEEPGRPLTEAEAPGLWEMVREVARAAETRPVDDIRVLPGTDMAVYEHGNRREQLQDRAKRVLLLGVGLLNEFAQPGFKAVLAHEYGHFSHRDTAGGDLALRTNATMMKFAEAMYANGVAVWWNIGFQFLRLYHCIFRRISHGASRLQEVLADRLAARLYGAPAFEAGLRHVIQRSAEFEAIAETAITDAIKQRRPVANLYALPAAVTDEVEAQIKEELERATTEDDTHPAPADRWRLVRRVASTAYPGEGGAVWDLFADRDGLTREMNALVDARVQEAFAAQGIPAPEETAEATVGAGRAE